ncbi:MAG TPA: YkvA family protein [Pyrinomonadaceae bacterium]|nr:YkvA family protein [Pyrinomonadaceae bacterium]
MSEVKLRDRMKNLLLFVPNLLLLAARLMIDPRVPATERVLVAGAILYALIPLDFIPDVLPFIGQIDDAYLVALSLLRLMTVTDPGVVRDHWRGGGDVVELVGATALVAKKLLPSKIRRVLTAHVEVKPSLPELINKSRGQRPVDHTVDSVRQPTNY